MATLTRLNVSFPPFGSYFPWGSQITAWQVSGATSATRVKLLNADGTLTLIIGTGFLFDASKNATAGTISQVVHLAADGLTQIERITAIPPGTQLTAFQANLTSDVGGLLSGTDTVNGSSQYVDVLFGYAGNDTFNPGSVAGQKNTPAIGMNFDVLVGGAGNDTFNSGSSNKLNYIVSYGLETGGAGVSVNLVAGTAIDTFGDTDTFNNVRYVVATNQADSLTGGALDDIFAPGGGNDAIDGGGGFNILSYAYSPTLQTDGFFYTSGITVNYASSTAGTVTDPLSGTDTFSNIQRVAGTNFADTYNGHAGTQQVFSGMGGADVYNGNAGDGDMVDASSEYLSGGTLGIVANVSANDQNGALANRLVDSFGSVDVLTNIAGVIGTEHEDWFYGGSGNNRFVGNGAMDRFRGNGGSDTFDGGAGRDIAEYRFENGGTPTHGITVNLTSVGNGTVLDTSTGTDTLINVEQINGSNVADTYNGSSGEDRFAPGRGDDTITSGGGRDVIIYSLDTGALVTGIVFDGGLASNQLISGYYGTDTFIGFTAGINLVATHLTDTLTGTAASDILQPSTGIDHVDGGAGRDFLAFTDPNTTSGVIYDAATGTSGTVTDSGGSVDDYTNIEVLRGSQFDDIFNGSTGNDTFQGLAGVDDFLGNGGVDTVDYSSDNLVATFFNQVIQAIDVDLGTGTGTDSFGFIDTFDGITAIIGTGLGDQITGSASNNRLSGRLGADTMTGGGGNDWFIFDSALGSTNIDLITDFTFAAGNNDLIRLSSTIFGAAGPNGTLAATAFAVGAVAADAGDRIIYDSATGALYYDADGNGLASAQVQFATLGDVTHPVNITASDFFVF